MTSGRRKRHTKGCGLAVLLCASCLMVSHLPCRLPCWLACRDWRAATIRENILQGRPGASEDDMIAAAKMANAHQFISDFANGYDTFCGEGGKQLSGQSVSRRMPRAGWHGCLLTCR